jgi:predicted DNA-binding protein (UPF0251 family)
LCLINAKNCHYTIYLNRAFVQNDEVTVGRPVKCRRVSLIPGLTYFRPEGIPVRCLDEVRMSLEEAEAVRLKDIEGLEQEEGAHRMNVSRPTFQRVLTSARHKLADAVLTGKAIRIQGGHFEIAPVVFRCANGHEWELAFEIFAESPPQFCPVCNVREIEARTPGGRECPRAGHGRCCRRCPRASGPAGSLFMAPALQHYL